MTASELPQGITLGDDGAVTFAGRSGRALLLGLILRAKFARPLERHAALNRWLAGLAAELSADQRQQPSDEVVGPDLGDDTEFRAEVVSCIITDAMSGELPWWSMSKDDQEAFIRDVAVAPHSISKFNIEEIALAVQDEVLSAQRLLEAVAKTTGK